LLDAEAVLLVDDHDTERRELHSLLDQRVRADDEVDPPVGQPGQHITALVAGDAVGEERDPQRALAEQGRTAVLDGEAVEQLGHRRRMLLGQYLGRRHQRALMAALHRREQRRHRHHRLARAHIALQQTVHRVRPGQVGLDLLDGAALGTRQWER